tara:strand:+ start:1283 stop:2524 length:1242 start_codon:yes stop_codon:yes gene_type:complete
MLFVKARKLIGLLLYCLIYSNTVADPQILILVEPNNSNSEHGKLKASDWNFSTKRQKISINKVLERSSSSRQKVLKNLFGQGGSHSSEEKRSSKLQRPKNFSRTKVSDQHYFQLHNRDWTKSVNKQFNSTESGLKKITPARFLELPEYHFDKSAPKKQKRKSYIRSSSEKKGAHRFQPTITRLFSKQLKLPKKQNYRIIRRNSEILDSKETITRRSRRARNARIQTKKIYHQMKIANKTNLTLKPPKGQQSRWTIGIGARTSRDKGTLRAYKNESSFNLSRNTSRGDQWFLEWTRANDSLGKQAKFETLGLGFKKFYEGYNDDRRINPYVAMMVKNWRGKINDINGLALKENIHNKLIPVARLGLEYQINNLTNLDLHIDGNGNYMKFIDVNDQKYEIKSHHSSVGLGVNYEF